MKRARQKNFDTQGDVYVRVKSDLKKNNYKQMKRNEIINLTFNPFTRIAGWQALALGVVIMLLMAMAGTYANVYFDGAIDMHFTEKATLKDSLNCLGIDFISLVLTLSVAGLIIAKNFRLLDILGTVSLAKAPFLLLAIASMAVNAPNLEEIMKDPSSIFSSFSFVVLMVLTIPIMIWHIILLFNAFKVSTGAIGNKVVPAFIIALLVAEIISKILISYLL